MTLRHLNPDGMASSPAVSQGVLVSEPGDLLVVGGQNGVGRLTIYLVAGPDVRVGYEAAQRVWGAHPTAVSVLQVAGLARPALPGGDRGAGPGPDPAARRPGLRGFGAAPGRA